MLHLNIFLFPDFVANTYKIDYDVHFIVHFGGGGGGQVEEGNLTEGGSRSRRKPLRGRRRGTKNSKMSEGEKERLALYMAKWLGRRPT